MWVYIRLLAFLVFGYFLAIIKNFHYVPGYIVFMLSICTLVIYVSGVKEGSSSAKEE